MRGIFLTVFMVFLFAGGAAKADPPDESAALLRLVSARLQAALAGQAYTVSSSCTANDCSIVIENK